MKNSIERLYRAHCLKAKCVGTKRRLYRRRTQKKYEENLNLKGVDCIDSGDLKCQD